MDEALDKYLQIALDKHYVKTPDTGDATSGGVLSGCVICISKKLSSQTSTLSAMITSLGGVYRASLDSSTTHLVFQVSPEPQLSFWSATI